MSCSTIKFIAILFEDMHFDVFAFSVPAHALVMSFESLLLVVVINYELKSCSAAGSDRDECF